MRGTQAMRLQGRPPQAAGPPSVGGGAGLALRVAAPASPRLSAAIASSSRSVRSRVRR